MGVTGCLGGSKEPFAQDALEPRLELEVGLAAVHGDDELGQLEAPLAREQLQDEVGPRLEAQPDELGLVRVRPAEEVDGAVRVRGAARRVVRRAPHLAGLAHRVHTMRFMVRPVLAARAPRHVLRTGHVTHAIAL